MMKNFLVLLLFFFSFTTCSQHLSIDSTDVDSVIVNEPLSGESLFNFISKKEILEITLKANFDTLITNKKRLVEYLPGKLTFNNGQEEETSLKVNLRPRGKFRRKVCDFPPLRIKFKKKGLRNIGLSDEFNSLKLVTHCMSDEKVSKQNVLKEYLVYKMYNLHSEYSLRIQLAKITYVQSGSKEKLFERYGLFIEDEEELASRVNASVVDRMGYPLDSVSVHGGTVQALFQCMIGNADWSLFNLRNVKLLRTQDQNKLCILPYDFDCSGAVNADYAVPNPDYGLTSVKQRVFLGKMHSKEDMVKAANHFLDKKDATFDLINNFDHLPKYERKDMINYLKAFYRLIKSEKRLMGKLAKISPKN